MLYKVINTLKVGNNTAVMLEGDITKLKNGMLVTGTTGNTYKVISVGMTAGIDPNEIGKTTDCLIEGSFGEKELII